MTKPYRASGDSASRREVYEVDEIRMILRACPDTPTGHRDRFAVMLLWCTGLKPTELLSMRPRDFKGSTVQAGAREVVVPGGQRDRLRELHDVWWRHRSAIAKARSPLVCNLRGGQLDTSYIRHMLAGLSDAADLGKRLHAQGFRNTFAASMHYAGVPLEVIRRQLGLSDLEYTAGYVAMIAPVRQHRAMATFTLED